MTYSVEIVQLLKGVFNNRTVLHPTPAISYNVQILSRALFVGPGRWG